MLQDTDIPAAVCQEAIVQAEEAVSYTQIDVLWHHIFTMKVIGSTELKFDKLHEVVKSVLVIPNSNASEERVFSMVSKNKTPFRPSLGLEGTLSSIIGIKLGIDDPCEKFEPSKQLLKDANLGLQQSSFIKRTNVANILYN